MRPNYFVRIISKRTKVVDCIVRLRNSNYGDLSVAVELAQWIFDDEHSWSIYAMKCRHRHDEGHACGLMAATIASDDFNENARRRCREKVQRWLTAKMKNQDASRDDLVELIKSKPPMTIIFDSAVFPSQFEFSPSPEHNMSFVAADELHFDISGVPPSEFTSPVLKAFREGLAVCTILTPEDFRTQAAIALSSCLRKYGSCELPARNDKRDQRLSPNEQLDRLRTIAGDYGWQSHAVENSSLPDSE